MVLVTVTGLDAVSVPVVENVGEPLADAVTPTDRVAVGEGVPDAPDDALAVELMDADAPRVRLPERVPELEWLVVSDGVNVALAVAVPVDDVVCDALVPVDSDAVAAAVTVALTERDTDAEAGRDAEDDAP